MDADGSKAGGIAGAGAGAGGGPGASKAVKVKREVARSAPRPSRWLLCITIIWK